LKLIYKDYLPWIQSKTTTLSHRPITFISYDCSIKILEIFSFIYQQSFCCIISHDLMCVAH
jgi:hypothetical protein